MARAGRLQSISLSAGPIFSAYVTSPACGDPLDGSGVDRVEHGGDALHGEGRKEFVGATGVGVIRDVDQPGVAHRTFVDTRRHFQRAHADLGLAGHKRPLDGRRSAPVRHERRVHHDGLHGVEHTRSDDLPVRADDEHVGLEREERLEALG